MTIEKNGKTYKATEYTEKWKVERKDGRLTVAVDVPKDLCPTEDELRAYVNGSELF